MDFSKILEKKRNKHAKRKAATAAPSATGGSGGSAETGADVATRGKTEDGRKTDENGPQTDVKSTKQDQELERSAKNGETERHKIRSSSDVNRGNSPGSEEIVGENHTRSKTDETGQSHKVAPDSSPSQGTQNTAASNTTPETARKRPADDGPKTQAVLDVQGAKKEQYKAHLERENAVPLQIQVSDIAERNLPKLLLQIRKFLKDILGQWTAHEESTQKVAFYSEKRSFLAETKKDIVKLLYKLRSGKLLAEMVISLLTIVHYIQDADLMKANEAYLKLSIGNVAWPIGVRDVGIHARAADAKIAGDDKLQLANIMKLDSTRRWLIAVKRVLNYCGELRAGQSTVITGQLK